MLDNVPLTLRVKPIQALNFVDLRTLLEKMDCWEDKRIVLLRGLWNSYEKQRRTIRLSETGYNAWRSRLRLLNVGSRISRASSQPLMRPQTTTRNYTRPEKTKRHSRRSLRIPKQSKKR